MASLKFYSKSSSKDENLCTIHLRLRHRNKERQFSTGIRIPLESWDPKKQEVLSNAYHGKSLNSRLLRIKSELYIQFSLIEIDRIGKRVPFEEYENIVSQYLYGRPGPNHSFSERMMTFANRHQGRTRDLYLLTIRRLSIFAPEFNSLTFDDIDREFLIRFNQWMIDLGNSPNYRGIMFRNMRAVFRDALASELTLRNPFNSFKIPHSNTPKRSLSAEQLRTLFDFDGEAHSRAYVDVFKLSFLFCGINMIDLYNLEEIIDGRISYQRSKTGRFFDLRVEPEAMSIIESMRGNKKLINLADRYSNHLSYISKINKNLKRIGKVTYGPRGKKLKIEALFPELSTYWARHTWATIAAELDIPDKIISLALGHAEEQTVTDIYIRRNRKKVDEANRKVIDWVLYGIIDGKVVVDPWSREFYGDMADFIFPPKEDTEG